MGARESNRSSITAEVTAALAGATSWRQGAWQQATRWLMDASLGSQGQPDFQIEEQLLRKLSGVDASNTPRSGPRSGPREGRGFVPEEPKGGQQAEGTVREETPAPFQASQYCGSLASFR